MFLKIRRTMFIKNLQVTLLVLFLFSAVGLSAQDSDAPRILDLETCIKIALDKNLDIKRARNDALIASSNHRQSKFEFYPNVNATIDYGLQNGLQIDPTTGTAGTENTQLSNPRINASIPIYQGRSITNTYQRNKMLSDASQLDIASSIDNTEISITGFYLQVLLSKENIKISEERIKLLEGQLERAEKRVELGVENNQQVYNLKSQIANEKLTLVTVNNTFFQNKLLLLQQLLLDPTEDYEIVGVEIEDEEVRHEALPYKDYYNQAEEYSPALKSAELGINASKKDYEIAKAGGIPSFNGFLSYSSQYWDVINVDGNEDFLSQMKDNKTAFAGVSLNIPIFNNYRVKNNMAVAKINMDNANLALEQAEIDLHNRLQQAYLDLLTALSTYNASVENYEALDQAFRFSETSYKSGNADFYSYIEALNNKNRAELEINNAKYSIVFRKRILDVLSGNE